MFGKLSVNPVYMAGVSLVFPKKTLNSDFLVRMPETRVKLCLKATDSV